MDESIPNSWLVSATNYFCFVSNLPVSYQNLLVKNPNEDDDEIEIKDWRKKVRKPYTRNAPFQAIPEYEAMRKEIERFIMKNRYLKIGAVYDLMDAQDLIPISKTYGEKITKGAFSHHYKTVKKSMVLEKKTLDEMISEMHANGETVRDIALKLCTNRDYVTRQIKRLKDNE